jgi:TolB-like protein
LRHLFGNYSLDSARRELRRGDNVVHVEPQVFDLLLHLIDQRGRVVTRDDLIASVWQGRIVSESTLSSRINAARRAIGDSGEQQQFIRTVARRGVIFVGDVREEAAAGRIDRSESDATAPALHQDSPESSAPQAAGEKPGPAVEVVNRGLPLPDKASIAVLPFQNLSDDPAQEYFCDGMADDIITGLSHCGWLFVIARNSSFTYKGRNVDVRQVGRELGVRYVLEGSVRKAGNRVRVTGQLVEAESGRHLWAQRFDRDLDDIFALQDDITLSVIGAMEPTMRDLEVARVRRKPPDSLDAYDAVLRAMPHITTTPMPEEALKAIPFLEKALALEPDYARAHAFLGFCNEILFMRAGFNEENRLAAIRHARAAITLGHDDATALTFGAFVTALVEHDQRTAFEVFDRALALAPFSAYALGFGATAAAWTGQTERAAEWSLRALRLNPLGTMAYQPHHCMAIAHFMRGEYDLSLQAAQRAVQGSPTFSICYLVLIPPLVKLGRMEEAKAAAARVMELQSRQFSIRQISEAYGFPEKMASMIATWREAGLPE